MNPETTLAAGRVTAGLPALDPSQRFQHAKRELHDHKQRLMHEDVAQKRDAAIAPDGDRDRADLKASIGLPLHSSTIIARLAQLNPSLIFKHHPFLNRFTIHLPDSSTETKDRYICAFEDNYSPQFEIIHWHWEEHVEGEGVRDARLIHAKVVDSTTRGWIPLLRKLISQKIITKAGAERLFGTINSATWQSALTGY